MLGGVAHGAEDTATYSVTVPVRPTDWSDTVSLPRFDPALGELRAIDLSIDAHLDATIRVENLAPTIEVLTTRLSATVTVSRPGPSGTVIGVAQPAATRAPELAAFDGAVDHSGASGDTTTVAANQVTTTTLSAPADLSLFTGTAPIVLRVAGDDTSMPPTQTAVNADLDTSVGATVTVTYTYVSDTRPPDPPTILSAPPAFTADPHPTVTFSAEPGTVTECRLATPSSTGSWAPCTSPWTRSLTSADDGAYTFSVRATDAAGNVGAPTSQGFTLDRVPPPQPILTFEPAALGRSPLPVWAFTIEPGSTARCGLDGAVATACSSPFAPDLTAAPDGLHTFSVVAADAAGNTSPPTTDGYHLDRQAPAPPTITASPVSPGNDSTPTWGLELAPDAVSATCSVDGAPFAACGTSLTADLSAAVDGPHSLSVRNADAAGNQSAATTSSYELDRAAPAAPTITSPPSPSKVTTPVWGITTDAGAVTECRLDTGPWVACAGSFTTAFGAGSDGVHVFAVRATDKAGNRGPEATTTYTLDTTAPGLPAIGTWPADPSNGAAPIWTFTVDADSTAACSLDGGAWIACASSYTGNLAGAADGWHQLAVRATDPQGNVGPAAVSGFTLDRTAPAAPSITSAPSSPGSSASVSWSFTTPEGTTARCRIDMGLMAPCWGAVSATFTDDGTHRLTVVAIDAAGNRSASTMAMYTLDRVAPAAPTLTSVPTSPDRVPTPQWSFAVEDASTGDCRIDDSSWVPCTSTFIADLSGAADGPHVFHVRSVDGAGNIGATSTATFVLDRTAPGAPMVTGAPDSDSQDDTPTWAFVVEAGASALCRVDDGPWEPCAGSFTPDLTGAADGIHALEVRAVDMVGNEGPTTVATYELDRIAPDAPTLTAVPLSPSNDPTPEWGFTYEPGTTAWCAIDGATAVVCDGLLTTELLADGTHEVVLLVVDAAGNASAPATSTYELDTAAPDVPRLTAPRTPDSDTHPEWGIEVEPGAVAECSFDDREAVACGAVFTADLAGLDGTHRLSVIARDAAGNVSEAVTSTYVLDTVAPAAPVLLHTPDPGDWTWRFSIEARATAECSVDGGPFTTCSSPLPGGAPGQTVRFEVRAVDRAGNRSAITRTTVTPAMASTVGPPPPGGSPPLGLDPAPTDAGPTGGGGEMGETFAAPRGVARPPVTALPPKGPDEVQGSSLARRFRPQEGPFGGPVGELLQAAAETTTIPVLVILIVGAFVAIQNRIDRRDPKLAAAPLRNEPEYMEFD